MFFLIKSQWGQLNKEIWDSLERSVSAPMDVYVELLRYMNEKHGFPASIEALNDPKLAREEFRELSTPLNETSCIAILEGFYEVLSQFGAEIAEKYRMKLNQYIEQHNLRYNLTSTCNFRLSLSGLLMTQCAYLYDSLNQNSDRLECLVELENGLSKVSDPDGEKNCIRIASNLLEGLTLDKANISATTMTQALEGCPDLFPHNALKECVKNIYKFSCDYPNIRHPGNPANRIRPLRKDDALLIIALTLGLGSFITTNEASETILAGDF